MSARPASPGETERGALRRLLTARHGKRCFYCGRNFKPRRNRRKTFDHYIPYALWPGWEPANLVLACEACNTRKGSVLPWPLVWSLLRVVEGQV
ncbi:MAG: endonuclease [Streptosporangiales bacterium]|nr:endonuclease [Streptosporangiales bacterium]